MLESSRVQLHRLHHYRLSNSQQSAFSLSSSLRDSCVSGARSLGVHEQSCAGGGGGCDDDDVLSAFVI